MILNLANTVVGTDQFYLTKDYLCAISKDYVEKFSRKRCKNLKGLVNRNQIFEFKSSVHMRVGRVSLYIQQIIIA